MKLVVAAYSEDAAHGSEVATHWFDLLLKQVVVKPRTDWIRPTFPEGLPRQAMQANRWKSAGKPRDRALTTDLVRDIAGRLAAGHVVVIHVDQDGSDENVTKLNKLVLARVRQLLEDHHKDAAKMAHLLVLASNRAIEAWCYLHHRRLLQLVEQSNSRRTALLGQLVEHLEASDEHHLDHWEDLKGIVHGPPVDHRELVKKGSQFPTADAERRSPSLRATLQSFQQNQALIDYVRQHVLEPD